MVHILIGEQGIITDHINLVAVGGMDHIVDRDIPVKQTAMRVIIMMLPVEEETRAALRIQIPEQYTQTATGKITGQVYGCGGFSNASLDIIDSDFFQRNKTSHKTRIAITNRE